MSTQTLQRKNKDKDKSSYSEKNNKNSHSGIKKNISAMKPGEQTKALTPNKPLESKEQLKNTAQEGIQGTGRALPFLSQIQKSFGQYNISSLVAHTDDSASQANKKMGSEAFTTLNHIAFKEAPDLFTAAHEATHIIQQRAGIVLEGGVGQEEDEYEVHADTVHPT